MTAVAVQSLIMMNHATLPDAMPASPCTGVCRIDAGSDLCAGCARTLDEIATWSRLDTDARAAVLAALPGRMSNGRGAAGAAQAAIGSSTKR